MRALFRHTQYFALTCLLLLIVRSGDAQFIVRASNFGVGCTCGNAVSYSGSLTIGGVTRTFNQNTDYLLFNLPSDPSGTTPTIRANSIVLPPICTNIPDGNGCLINISGTTQTLPSNWNRCDRRSVFYSVDRPPNGFSSFASVVITQGPNPICITSSRPTDCISITDEVTVTATTGYGNDYTWSYFFGGSFLPFAVSPGNGSSITFDLEDVFGAGNVPENINSISFRATVNGDGRAISALSEAYTFNPVPPVITGANVSGETCFGDNSTEIVITSTNRPRITNETFTYELRSSTDLNDAVLFSTTSNVIRASDVPGGIPNGNYFILTIGAIGAVTTNCGDPVFVAIDPVTGPTDPITSANAGTDQVVCGTTAPITGNTTDVDETGIWTRVAGSGTIANPNSRNTSITGLGAGANTFRWTITQNFGCISSDDMVINRIDVTSANAGTNQNVCSSTATLGANSPDTGENGSWSLVSGAGSFTNSTLRNTTVSGLSEGNNIFRWTIQDDGNVCSNSDDVIINFTDLTVPTAGSDQQACNADVVLNANTTKAGETGTWSVVNGTGTFDNVSSPVTTVSGLNVGINTFRWTITDNSNNCPALSDDIVVELSNLNVDEVLAQRNNPSCFGEADGSITFVGNGGTGIPTGLDYQFILSNGEQQFADAGQEVTFTELSAGSYSVTIEDDLCIRSSQIIILSNPAAISVSETVTDFNGTPISCNGENDGQIVLDVSGGNGGFTYQWSNGETTRNISNLTAGTYSVIVEDTNGCERQETYVLSEPFELGTSRVMTDVTCNGESNGSIDLDVTGGTAPYNYLWSNGEITQDINSLTPGIYSVMITDVNGCNINVNNLNVDEPALVVITISNQQQVACNGEATGKVILLGTGGTGVKEYSQDGVNYQTSPIFSDLAAGDYTFLIRDGNGCNDELFTTITEPTLLTSSVTNQVNATCNEANGSALANASGGTGDYTFEWRNNDNQQVSTSAQLDNVAGGIYTVTITDGNGCTTINTATISSTDGAQTTANNITPTSCFDSNDGQATLNIIGADPFIINWENGETGFSAVRLAPGDNNVSITDNNGCTTVEVVNIPAPDAIVATIQSTTIPTCDDSSDGVIDLKISGGSGGYTFLWNTGVTTNTLSGIPAGDYTIIITDSNDCSLTSVFSLEAIDPIAIEIINSTSPSCFGDTDGSIEIKATGGNGGYGYLWNNGNTTPNLSNLAAGDYQLTVTDVSGCTESFNVDLPETEALEVDLGGDRVVCTGSVLTISAPIDNATYFWTSSTGFSSSQQQVTLEEEGTYTLEVTNANGCTGADSFNLTASDDLLQADFLMVSEAYTGDTIVIIDITWPIPETLFWEYGSSDITLLTQNADFSEVVFNTPGIYNVSIETNLGDCRDINIQPITILDRKDKANGRNGLTEEAKPLIKNFKVFPNPNDGKFEIAIELNEISDIKLWLIDLYGNKVVLTDEVSNKSDYSRSFELIQLTKGLYLVKLVVSNEEKVLRMIIR